MLSQYVWQGSTGDVAQSRAEIVVCVRAIRSQNIRSRFCVFVCFSSVNGVSPAVSCTRDVSSTNKFTIVIFVAYGIVPNQKYTKLKCQNNVITYGWK